MTIIHTLAVAASFGLENIVINLIKKMTTSLVSFLKAGVAAGIVRQKISLPKLGVFQAVQVSLNKGEKAMSSLVRIIFAAFFFSTLIFFSSSVAAVPHEHEHMHEVHSEFDFLVEMIPHHQEAVDSSKEIKSITGRSELQEFAREIIAAQEKEIQELKEWIQLWYADRHAHARYEPMMRDIAGLSVEEAEQIFLEDMIAHHEMAVMMARDLLENDLAEHAEVEDMARSIIEQQDKEIEIMHGWLKEWF